MPRSFPVGYTATAGSLVYSNEWGASSKTPNAYHVQVIALADPPISELVVVWVNGELITLGDTAHAEYGFPVLEHQDDGRDFLWIKFYGWRFLKIIVNCGPFRRTQGASPALTGRRGFLRQKYTNSLRAVHLDEGQYYGSDDTLAQQGSNLVSVFGYCRPSATNTKTNARIFLEDCIKRGHG